MRSALCVALAIVGLSLAVADDTTTTNAAAASVAYSPQEKVLAQSAFGNFACRVNSIRVTTENPGLLPEPVVKDKSVLAAFANVATLEWAHIPQTSFSSFDGRNDEKVLGTPGGDMGEFIQGIQAYATVTKKALTEAEVGKMFEKYLKTMTRAKFFYETDEKAYTRIAVRTGCRNLHVSEMGGMKRKRIAYLELVALPEHIGDPFIRFLATNATELSLESSYIHSSLSAFHNVLWTSPSKLSLKLCYLETKGPSTEAAIVNIVTPSYCVDQGLAPMVSPLLSCSAPVFVNHPEAVKVLRRELVAVLTEGKDVDASAVMAEFNRIAETNLQKFLAQVAGDLPIYTVHFQNSSPLLTADATEFAAEQALEE